MQETENVQLCQFMEVFHKLQTECGILIYQDTTSTKSLRMFQFISPCVYVSVACMT
jgi:hypothetical protein